MEESTKLFDFDSDDIEPLMSLPISEAEDVVFRSVKALPFWTGRSIGVTNVVINYFAGRSIAWSDRRDIGSVRSLIRRLQSIHLEGNQHGGLDVKDYYTRWNGVISVLESRAHLLDYVGSEKIQREKL